MVLLILEFAILIRAILSWFPLSTANPFVKILYEITEPLLKPFRRIRLGGSSMVLDLSPIFALLTLMLIRAFVLTALFNLLARILIY